ncbi:hypothetical protein [Herbaspirillum sp. NPDC101396]|uniref:hypothetical protein n=1 Tax=Herbaspirillum sp. NPDC101396 TaxID=3364005 RepID=UPI00383BA85F
MRGLIVVGVTALILAGCATTPVSLGDATAVPAERIFAQASGAAKDWPRITVVRDSGYLASGCDFGFYLDGRLAARMAVGERFSIEVPPGEHILGAAIVGRALCSFGEDQRREIASIVQPGEKKVYRISARSDGGVLIEPTTMLQAR